MKATRSAGWAVLLIKLGPKLLPLILKLKEALFNLAKSAMGIKGVGFAASAGVYGYLFTWQMGLALVLFIGIHEYGHLWAMRRCGIKTRGMFFIPGFGAVAVADERFGSARNESFIAIMGPVFGFAFFILPCLVYWLATKSDMFAAFAVVGTFVNLLNLLTIMPLDGGRMLKSIVYSNNHGRSFLLTLVVSAGTAIAAGFAGFFLFAYMAFIGFLEMFDEFGIAERTRHLMTSLFRILCGASWLLVVKFLFFSEWAFSEERVAVIFAAIFFCFVPIATLVDIYWGASRNDTLSLGHVRRNDGIVRPLASYPMRVVRELGIGVVELFSLRLSHVQPIKDYEFMGSKERFFYAAMFFGAIAIHAAVLVGLSITPEGALMGDMFK